MRINEVSKLTGLTKKAINYYEKQGLIKPSKDSNGYRTYEETEISRLREIGFFRSMDISIRDIREIIYNRDKVMVLRRVIEEKHRREEEIREQRESLEKIMKKYSREASVKSKGMDYSLRAA